VNGSEILKEEGEIKNPIPLGPLEL